MNKRPIRYWSNQGPNIVLHNRPRLSQSDFSSTEYNCDIVTARRHYSAFRLVKAPEPCIAHSDGSRDGRYSVTLEYVGHPAPKYVARFCGDFILACAESLDAWHAADKHTAERGMGGRLIN